MKRLLLAGAAALSLTAAQAQNFLPQGGGAPDTGPSQIARSTTAAAASLSISVNNLAGQAAYVTEIQVTGLGATAATVVAMTLSHVYDFSAAGDVTFKWEIAVPAGVTTGITPLVLNFNPPLYINPADTSFALTIPSFGSGNTNVTAALLGYYQ